MTESKTNAAPPPAPDFNYLAQTIFIPALINAGKLPNPLTQKLEPNKELAKFHISLLELLERKTRGNLTEQEQRMLESCLHQVRTAFVEMK